MKRSRRKFLSLAASAGTVPSLSRRAWAQAYPSRPVRAVVAFAPGGVTDTFGRLMAQKLTDQVAKAAPDGYTILFAFSSHVVNPTLFARLPSFGSPQAAMQHVKEGTVRALAVTAKGARNFFLTCRP